VGIIHLELRAAYTVAGLLLPNEAWHKDAGKSIQLSS